MAKRTDLEPDEIDVSRSKILRPEREPVLGGLANSHMFVLDSLPPYDGMTEAQWKEYSEKRTIDLKVANKEFAHFPNRVKNCLINEDMFTLAEVAKKTDNELLSMPNFGKLSLAIVRAVVPGPSPQPSQPPKLLAKLIKQDIRKRGISNVLTDIVSSPTLYRNRMLAKGEIKK